MDYSVNSGLVIDMTKKIEYKPKCVLIAVHTWETLRNFFGVENVVGYLILKVNVNRVTYSTHKIHATNTLDEGSEIVSVCIGTQIADTVTLKCDDEAISYFVNNHGKFVFIVKHSKGIIRDGSVRFEDLDWADKNDHLQSYLDEVFSDE